MSGSFYLYGEETGDSCEVTEVWRKVAGDSCEPAEVLCKMAEDS